MQRDQGNESGHLDDQPDNEAAPKHDWFLTSDKPPTPDLRRDDNMLYKFKEGNFPRLNLCDIEDMLLLLVQKKLSNLDVDDRYDLGVALKMFTSQNRRDLPRDIPLDSVVVFRYEKKSESENKGKVPTKMELVLEQTQQGTSYEVSVSAKGVEEFKRKVKINGEKKEALLTLRQKPGQYICYQESQR
ncbi:hypothetical protein Tco_1393880 [Tanacetum coccineum]